MLRLPQLLGFIVLCIVKYIWAQEEVNVAISIMRPTNKSISGSHIEITLHVELTLTESGQLANNHYEGVNLCIFKNQELFACIDAFNPHYALMCEVGHGATVVDVVAAHSASPLDVVSAAHASVEVFRPDLRATTRGSLPEVEEAVVIGADSSVAVVPSCSALAPLKMMLDAMVPLYRPLQASVLLYSDAFEAPGSDTSLACNAAVAALLVAPIRLVLLNARAEQSADALNADFCSRLDATSHVTCGNVSFSDVDQSLNVQALPAVLHIAVAYIVNCPRGAAAGEQRAAVLRRLARAAMKRASGHFIVILSEQCAAAGAVDRELRDSANQTFSFPEYDQVGFVFVNPMQQYLELSAHFHDRMLAPTKITLHHYDSPGDGHWDSTSQPTPVLHMTHTCLLRNNSLVVFTAGGDDPNNGPGSANTLFTESQSKLLNNAGFLPWIRRYDSSRPRGDRGFTNIFEVGVRAGEVRWNGKSASLGDVVWVRHKAVLVRPFYKSNIFHFVQSVAALLDMGGDGGSSSTADAASALDRDELVLLPEYFTTGYNIEWCDAFLEVAQQWVDRRRAARGNVHRYASQEQLHTLFEGPLASLVPAIDAEHKILCFEQVELTGQGNTDAGFFKDRETLYRFREHVWASTNPTLFRSICASSYRRVALEPTLCPLDLDVVAPASSAPEPVLLKVTFVLRSHNRFILNYHELLAVLRSPALQGVVDQAWLDADRHRGVVFDTLPFREQMALMLQSDVLIGVHGSVFANAVFMAPHSAAVALMQSRHIEYVLPQVVEQGDVSFHFVPLLDQNRTGGCACVSCRNARGEPVDAQGRVVTKPGHIYPDVCRAPESSLIRASQMDCLGIRQCDPLVDTRLFETVLVRAVRKILATKYRGRRSRLASTSTIVQGQS